MPRSRSSRPARVADVHAIAGSLPGVERSPADGERPAYKVGGKHFVLFRPPRPDALDPQTGERLTDVLVFWCTAEDKAAMVEDETSPWFTTPHWNGYNGILLREAALGAITVEELREVITDAWLLRAPKRLAKEFLAG